MNEKARFKPSVENYVISSELKKEVNKASQLYAQINGQMAIVFRDMSHNGFINISQVRAACTEMVNSVIRNPDALAWLCRIRSEERRVGKEC